MVKDNKGYTNYNKGRQQYTQNNSQNYYHNSQDQHDSYPYNDYDNYNQQNRTGYKNRDDGPPQHPENFHKSRGALIHSNQNNQRQIGANMQMPRDDYYSNQGFNHYPDPHVMPPHQYPAPDGRVQRGGRGGRGGYNPGSGPGHMAPPPVQNYMHQPPMGYNMPGPTRQEIGYNDYRGGPQGLDSRGGMGYNGPITNPHVQAMKQPRHKDSGDSYDSYGKDFSYGQPRGGGNSNRGDRGGTLNRGGNSNRGGRGGYDKKQHDEVNFENKQSGKPGKFLVNDNEDSDLRNKVRRNPPNKKRKGKWFDGECIFQRPERFLWSANDFFFKTRKAENFEKYVEESDAMAGIQEGKYFEGEAAFMKGKSWMCKVDCLKFVGCKLSAKDNNTNRAFDGARIVFEPITEGWQNYLEDGHSVKEKYLLQKKNSE